MVRAIISWSLHNRLIVMLGVFALIGVGIHSALNLNVEAYPDPTPPLVEIISQNPGASPEEMERLVGIPLETALNGMPGLEDMRSTSISGLSDIKCQFAYGTDYGQARQEVYNRIGTVTNLPAGVIPSSLPGARPARSCATCWKGRNTRPTSSRPCRTGSSTAP